MPKKKDVDPVDILLDAPLPDNAEAFVAQVRAARQRVKELESKAGEIQGKIDSCKEEVLSVKQKYGLKDLQKRAKELRNDVRRLSYSTLERAEQMTIAFPGKSKRAAS